MAVHDFDWYLDTAAALIERDKELRKMQLAMERMSHLDYALPSALQRLQWMRAYRTTAPYDALSGATRALSRLEENLKIEPITVMRALQAGYDDDSSAARQAANEWETCLKWNMRKAAGRGAIFRPDIIRSAVLYDEVCLQVVHLPTQAKVVARLGGNTARYTAAMRGGPFVVNIRNPREVHARYSDLMCEAVLSVTVRAPQDIVDIWGDQAAEIAAKLDDDDAPESYLLMDYTDYDGRCVWAVPGDDEGRLTEYAADSDSIVHIVEPTALDYPFIPWVAVVGGTGLDSAPEHRRRPLLYPIYQAETWLSANIVGSLMMSDTIATAGSPRATREGPLPDSIEMDYGQPGGTADVPAGHKYTQLTRDPMDPALTAAFDRFVSEINTATVSKVLVTAEPSPGETFAGYNLRVQTAIGSLMPYKELGERAYAGAYELMLQWGHYTGTALSGYGDAASQRRPKAAAARHYDIQPEDIDPDTIYLGVELTPDVPIDRLQRINGAVQMARDLPGVPMTYILEELGVPDPDKAKADWEKEQYANAYRQGRIQAIQMQASGQLQQMAEQIASQMMQAQQEQQQQQAQQAQQQQGPPMSPQDIGQFGQMANAQGPLAGMNSGAPGGQGFNPAAGGLPPAMGGGGAPLTPRGLRSKDNILGMPIPAIG